MTLVHTVLGRLEGVTDADSEAEEEREAALSTDEVFHILQTKRRRDVLRFLRLESGPVEMRELAEQVAAWEQDTTVENLSSTERQRVYISLYQSHLPKLDEEGIVDYDKDRGIVERTPAAAQFDPYLEESVERERSSHGDRWPARYGLSICLGAFVLVGGELQAFPLEGLLSGLLALALPAIVAGAHVLSTRSTDVES